MEQEGIHSRLSRAQQLFQAGRYVEAEMAAQRAIQANPANPAAYFLLTESLAQQSKLTLANKAIDSALETVGETVELLAKASEVRHIAGRLPEAESFLDRALALAPENTRLRFQHAQLVSARCRYMEAIEEFSRLAEGRFFRDEALAGIAQAWERLGEIEKAHHYIDRAIAVNRAPSALVLSTLSNIAYQTGELDGAIDLLLEGTRRKNLKTHEIAGLHFSLGKLLDKQGDYANAFRHYTLGNKLLVPVYDWRIMGSRCKDLAEKFTADAVNTAPTATLNSNNIVFIVGLPRSGTSLVERILAAHPDVHGAGELDNIRYIANDIERLTGSRDPGPDDFLALGIDTLDQLSSRYIDVLNELGKGARRVIDKTPGNLVYLGLISTLFPDARIIHCVRNPLDTCLSCYFQQFHRSNSLAYTFDLDALAYTWQHQERLMSHWKSVLPVPIMDVVYENLVNNFENTTKSLLDFCDLEWNDAVNSYHQSDSNCHTASYEQVRRPIYKSSLNRWRNYEPYIQPLIDSLTRTGKTGQSNIHKKNRS